MKQLAILCIDDEKTILDSLQLELENVLGAEYLIEFAQDAQEALEVVKELQENNYDLALVIVDYIMPGLKGDDLMIQIHQMSPKTIKVMLTGQAELSAVAKVINQANLYRYLTKPWQVEDLILTVNQAIYRYCQEQKLESINEQQTALITELHASENRLKQFLEAIPVGVFITDGQGTPYYLNQEGQKIVGKGLLSELKAEELVKAYQSYIANSNELYPLEKTPMWRALQGESVTVNDLEIHIEGKIVPIESRGTPIYDQNGQVIYAIVAFQDITDRIQAQKLLTDYNQNLEAQIAERTEALKYQAAVDHLLSSIARQFMNQEAAIALNLILKMVAEFLGAERGCFFEYTEDQKEYILLDEWCVSGINSLFYPARANTVFNYSWANELLLKGEPIVISNIANLPPEAAKEKSLFQSQGIQSVASVPIILAEKVVGFFGVDTVTYAKNWQPEDIHLLQRVGELVAIARSRYKAEEAMRLAKEKAEAANQAKSTFLANMSHELRTPLNVILGYTQLMERDTTLNHRQKDFLSTINRSGEHLLHLINDVLEMSKIESGRTIFYPVAFELNKLLTTLQEMFAVRAKVKKLKLFFDFAEDLPQYVITDQGKLRQVLINLLSNAVKFTQNGHIILRASCQKNLEAPPQKIKLCFAIEDTGKGIAPTEIKELFQPFVQTKTGLQTQEGTGLGLAISRQFVQLMGGTIQVKSILGQGSTFSFEIEAQLADSATIICATPEKRVVKLAPNQPNYRILAVDDHQENCHLIANLLKLVGFATRTAANGEEAIACWQDWQPHLVWMDMRMPVMDGYEATQRIRQLEAQLPQKPPTIIIALTASAFDEQQIQATIAGCDDFVGKPFREQEIFEKISHYLGVSYIYEDKTSDQTPQTNTANDNLPESSLEVMPKEWLQQLHQASLRVNSKLITQLIQQIPEEHRTLADNLTNLVNQFRFDIILELTDKYHESC